MILTMQARMVEMHASSTKQLLEVQQRDREIIAMLQAQMLEMQGKQEKLERQLAETQQKLAQARPPAFSKRELARMEKAFKYYDRDGSGQLDRREFLMAFEDMGLQIRHTEMEELFEEADKDKDGLVSYDEYMAFAAKYKESRTAATKFFEEVCKVVYPAPAYLKPEEKAPPLTPEERQRMLKVFQRFDLDKNGYLDPAEFKAAFEHSGWQILDYEIHKLFEEADTNADGKITQDEFLAFAEKYKSNRSAATVLFEDMYDVFIPTPSYLQDDYRPIKVRPARLTPAEEDTMKHVFQHFDADDSGALDRKEFKVAFEAAGWQVLDHEMASLFEEADKDKDGSISYDEWLLFARKYKAQRGPGTALFEKACKGLSSRPAYLQQGMEEEKMLRAFQFYDKDGSGELDKWEFKRAFEDMGLMIMDYEVDALFGDADVDGNDKVDLEEFKEFVTDYKKSRNLGTKLLETAYSYIMPQPKYIQGY